LAPWRGRRHRSWASNTNAATVGFVVVFGMWFVWELVGNAPSTLNQLLGTAAGIWFGAVAGDKARRDREVEDKADRTEAKVEVLADAAVAEHPELAEPLANPPVCRPADKPPTIDDKGGQR
jgi:hypothetical protein